MIYSFYPRWVSYNSAQYWIFILYNLSLSLYPVPSQARCLLFHVLHLEVLAARPVKGFPSPPFVAYLRPWKAACRAFLLANVVAVPAAPLAFDMNNLLVLAE